MAAQRTAWIGLGANLGDPAAQLQAALDAIAALPETHLLAASDRYRTPPLGPPGQPDYCNAVASVATGLSPEALMTALLALERSAGRVRGGDRWGPRIIDLDLLHVEGERRRLPSLQLPHPEAGNRSFVMVPWAALAPTLSVPGIGLIAARARQLAPHGLPRWEA